MANLWAGRFSGAPEETLLAYGRSFDVDRRLFEDDVTGSRAWVQALAGAGVLTAAEGSSLDAALVAILGAGRADASFVAGDDEDVHSFVERLLIERVGDLGRRLHTGRSRNEQVSLDLRLYLRRRVPDMQRGVRALVAALADQADRAGDAVMPAYTHLRRAQPVLAAHFLLAHAAALRRDHDRLAAAAAEADAMPLGSGAIVGTAYAVDTAALARRLGFSRVAANSLDVSSDRDFVSSFLLAAAMGMVHLSRLSADIILFSTEEFGFFELADQACTGSSLMPQKKNPDPLELARGRTGAVIGRLAGWLTTLAGLPSGYNRDLQEDKPALFAAEDVLVSTLDAVRRVVVGMRLDAARARAAACGWPAATDLADWLVSRGMPFRRAHHEVGAAVRQLLAQGRTFDSLAPDEWRQLSPLFDGDMATVIAPETSVRHRATPQSTNPDAVRAQLADVRAWLK